MDQPLGRHDDDYQEGPLNALENHWQLRAVFTNSAGTATSNGATMTLVSAAAPVVTTQPLSQNYTSGSSVTFTAAASGTPTPTVQWQYSINNGSTWSQPLGRHDDDHHGGTAQRLGEPLAAPGRVHQLGRLGELSRGDGH